MAFRKFDFHVHTPKSVCYEDHVSPEKHLSTQPEDIVRAALTVGMCGIAITDHNTSFNVDAVREVAARNGLYLFPGMELTTRAGHMLAIFDVAEPRLTLEQLLKDLGFKREQEGDAFYESPVPMDQACLAVEQMGGLAIAAHVERRPRGFIASNEPLRERMRIHSSEHLSALEITVASDKKAWNEGLMPNYSKRYACIMDSDSHAPYEIGRRFTYIDMDEVNLRGLRRALKEYQHRMRFVGEMVDEDHQA